MPHPSLEKGDWGAPISSCACHVLIYERCMYDEEAFAWGNSGQGGPDCQAKEAMLGMSPEEKRKSWVDWYTPLNVIAGKRL